MKTNQMDSRMTRQDSYNIIAVAIAAGIDIFRNFPSDTAQWCYRILCGLFGGFIVAPVIIHFCDYAAKNIVGFGWLAISGDTPVISLVYAVSIMAAEPTITFLYGVIETDLPAFMKKKKAKWLRERKDGA